MPDSPLTDPDVSDEMPRRFAKLLQFSARGHVLWTPTSLARGQTMIGDCGYVAGGEFVKLYNVFDANQLGIEPLPRRDEDVKIQRATNVAEVLQSRSIQQINFRPSVDLSPVIFTPPSLKLRTAIENGEEEVAFMTLYGPIRVIATYLQTRTLEIYLAEHASQIVDHYGMNFPVKAHYLMIVYRTTASASWFGGYASSKRTHFEAGFSGPGAGVELDFSNAESSAWTLTRGEPTWDVENPPENCVILRSVRCRSRDRLKHTMRAFGKSIANIFGPSNRTPGFMPATSQTLPGSASVGDFSGLSTSDLGTRPADSEYRDGRNTDDASAVDGSQTEGDFQASEVTDLLDEVLDFILWSHPDIDCAVGNWEVISQFLEEHGDFPDGWYTKSLIIPDIEQRSGQVGQIAHLVGITLGRIPVERPISPTGPLVRVTLEQAVKVPLPHTNDPTAEGAEAAVGEWSGYPPIAQALDVPSINFYPMSQAFRASSGYDTSNSGWFKTLDVDGDLKQKLQSICSTMPQLQAEKPILRIDHFIPHLPELRAAPKDDVVSAFLNQIETHYAAHRPRFEALANAGQIVYEYLQEVYKPGVRIAVQEPTQEHFQAAEIVSAGFDDTYGPGGFKIRYRMLKGTTAGVYSVTESIIIRDSEDAIEMSTLRPRLLSVDESRRLEDSGRKFVRLLGNGGVHYVKISGLMLAGRETPIQVQVSGGGMVDPTVSDPLPFSGEASIGVPVEAGEIAEDMYWLLPDCVRCFSFVHAMWGTVRVADIELISNNDRAWDSLILSQKETIRAAVQADTESLPCPSILLHGPANVGKTFSVETLGKALGRPTYSLPAIFSSTTLALAERWNAILVVDNLEENVEDSMDSIAFLLRAEARRKIPVILIARQPSALPPSVMERITFSFEYKAPDFETRLKMWRLFIREALQNKKPGLVEPILEGKSINKLAEIPFTPLAIKEVIRTALSLANARGETAKLQHFREVAATKAQSLQCAGLALPGEKQLSMVEDTSEHSTGLWDWLIHKLRVVAQGFV